MGFTAGMTSSMGMGTPHYYIEDDGNQWDANTYANFVFDSSGSMGTIITPLQSAMTGPYFSSGSAASQNGVKSTTSLRAELQDVYATAGIEGSPDWNTNNATNGANAFNSHIAFRSLGDEDWLSWTTVRHSGNSSQTWQSLGNSSIVSNVVMVLVINESKPSVSAQANDGYHWTQFGAETEQDFVATVVSGSGVNYTMNTIAYTDNSNNQLRYGVVPDPDNPNTQASSSYDQYVYSAVDSSGNNVLSGTVGNTKIQDIGTISQKTIQLTQSQTWPAGTVVTFRMKAYGYYTTRADAGLGSPSGQFYTSDPANFPNYRNSVTTARLSLSGAAQNGTGYTSNYGFYGIRNTGPSSDNNPSVTMVVLDAGLNGGPLTHGPAQGNYISGNSSIQGPRAFSDTGPGGMTAQQMHTQYGVIEGRDNMHATRADSLNYSLDDMSDLLSWNGKSNLLTAIVLNRKNQETNVQYWKDQLKAALLLNLSF